MYYLHVQRFYLKDKYIKINILSLLTDYTLKKKSIFFLTYTYTYRLIINYSNLFWPFIRLTVLTPGGNQ